MGGRAFRVVTAVGVLALAACGGGGPGAGPGRDTEARGEVVSRIDGAPSPAVSVAEVVLSAEDGSTGASVNTTGVRVGHWFGPQRLDFRPEEYWESGAEVTVRIDLDGVEGADGVHGVQRKTVEFTVGRSQVSTVDVATQTMTVVRDGAPFESIPISSGGPGTPTYNGRMVISQKFVETRMDGSTVGFDYDIPDAPHAMRLTRSGTFPHGNYWYDGANPPFGVAGTSHGCVGLRDVRGGGADTPGKWFFDHSLVGDVVIVENSPDATVEPDNGLNGWNMPWSQWVAGSSL